MASMAVINRSLPNGMKKTAAKMIIIQSRILNSLLLSIMRVLNSKNIFNLAFRGNITFKFDFAVNDDGRSESLSRNSLILQYLPLL